MTTDLPLNAERHLARNLAAPVFSAAVHPEVLLQHKDDALFLASQRRAAVHAPNLTLTQLLRSDERLEAHLDGLVTAGDAGCEYLLREVPLDCPEAIFVGAAVAIACGNRQAVDLLLSTCLLRDAWREAFIAALGFTPATQTHALLQELLRAPQPARQALALLGSATHSVDANLPRDLLPRAILSADPALRSAAFQTAGLLGRTDCAFLIVRSVTAADPELRFQAAWSSARLGLHDGDVLETLRQFAEGKSAYAPQALAMLLRCSPLEQAHRWIKRLQGIDLRLALIATAQLGDPALLPAALDPLDDPRTARLAAETFHTLTGVSLNDAGLTSPQPENFEAGPNDDPADPNVAPDPDEGLPWPAPALVRVWWAKHHHAFLPGVRYFCGQPLTRASLLHILHTGSQRHRNAAALELAILRPDEPFFPVHARARQQRALLQRFSQHTEAQH